MKLTTSPHGYYRQITLARPTLAEIHRDACRTLAVSGPRALHLAEDWDGQCPIGRQVYVSLYDGEDYTVDAIGRVRR